MADPDTTKDPQNGIGGLAAKLAGSQAIIAAIAAALTGVNGGLASVFRNYGAASTLFALFIVSGIIGGIVVSASVRETNTPKEPDEIEVDPVLVNIPFGAPSLVAVRASTIQTTTKKKRRKRKTGGVIYQMFNPLMMSGDDDSTTSVSLVYVIIVALAILGVAGYAGAQSRTDPGNFPVTPLVIFAAVVVLLAIPVVTRGPSYIAATVAGLTISAILFSAGSLGLGYLLIQNVRAVGQPAVTGSLTMTDKGMVLKATVTAQGLFHTQHVLVRIDGLRTEGDTWYPDVVFAQQLGPDEQGKVDSSIEVPIDPAVWRIVEVRPFIIPDPNATDDEKKQLGYEDHNPAKLADTRFRDTHERTCLYFQIPQVDSSPQITTDYTPATDKTSGNMKITATANGLQEDASHDQKLHVYVTGTWNDPPGTVPAGQSPKAEPPGELASTFSGPSGGRATATMNVPILNVATSVTVCAEIVDGATALEKAHPRGHPGTVPAVPGSIAPATKYETCTVVQLPPANPSGTSTETTTPAAASAG